MPTGTLLVPNPQDVRFGVTYGADGTEFTGQLVVNPAAGTLVPSFPTDLTIFVGVAGIANQSIPLWTLLTGLTPFFQLITGFPASWIRLWLEPSRPAIEGKDEFLWYRPMTENVAKSAGPGRFGNRADIKLEIHLLTRYFGDQSQVDDVRAERFYDTYWKLVNSLQGRMLFNKYKGLAKATTVWNPPVETKDALPLTVETMSLEDLPTGAKTQQEEGTLEATFVVNIPIVLALTVP